MGQFRGRRKFPRRNLPKNVGVLYRGEYAVKGGVAIGEGGLSFLSSQMVPVAEEVIITFKIPGGQMTSVRAEVRNHLSKDKNKVIHGLRFLNLSIEGRRKIRAFVASRPGSETPA